MKTTNATHETLKNVSDATDTETSVDVEERTLRALEEPMSVPPDGVDAVGIVEAVSHTGEAYVVDFHGGNCDCPDATYRLDETICKYVKLSRFVVGDDAVPAEEVTAKRASPTD